MAENSGNTVIGVDIGGTNTVFGIVDNFGNILLEDSFRTQETNGPEEFFSRLCQGIISLIEKADGAKPLGIGIGSPNGNYYKGTVEYPPNLKWDIVDVVGEIKKYLDLPVVVTNDANAAAIGEMKYGSAKGMKNFILITLGTGLGSGIVVNGEVAYGAYGFAGEIGHMTAIENGRSCGCGRKGCLETYASAPGLSRTAFELFQKQNDNIELRSLKMEDISSKKVYELAESGEALAIEAFDYTGKILGKKLGDAVAVTEPEAIILFGGLARAGNWILNPTQKALDDAVLPIFKNKVKVMPSGLQERNIAILGAAALIFHDLK